MLAVQSLVCFAPLSSGIYPQIVLIPTQKQRGSRQFQSFWTEQLMKVHSQDVKFKSELGEKPLVDLTIDTDIYVHLF